MKQIAIISGKGGTGKTVLTGAFAALVKNKVTVDCDVDAADLHLLLAPKIRESHQFHAGLTAYIDSEKCTRCGKCREVCRFDAIEDVYTVDPISCEGCAFCNLVCPADAIEMRQNISGEWFISDTRFGPMVHARLGVAQENSGKLVSIVRDKAREVAEEQDQEWVLIDGAPGIGCPVIASLSGVDCALVVTEPTLSGLHDAERVIAVAHHFNIPVMVVVNKYDLNVNMTERIECYCTDNDIPVVGKLKFDESIVRSMIEGKTIVEYANGETKAAVVEIWDSMLKNL